MQNINIKINGKDHKFSINSTDHDTKDKVINALKTAVGSDANVINDSGVLKLVAGGTTLGENSKIEVNIMSTNNGTGGIKSNYSKAEQNGANAVATVPAKPSKLEVDINDIGGTGYQTITITIDGVDKNIRLDSGLTKAQIISKVNSAIGSSGRAYLNASNNKMIIETTSRGVTSTVKINREPHSPTYNMANGGIGIGRSSAKGTRRLPGQGEKEVMWLGFNVSAQENASKSISIADRVISYVSKERSKLGAIQNRLEHTIKNLNNSAENTQSSESRIRDLDMAKEMSNFVRIGVIKEASMNMIRISSLLPQNVLSLLR